MSEFKSEVTRQLAAIAARLDGLERRFDMREEIDGAMCAAASSHRKKCEREAEQESASRSLAAATEGYNVAARALQQAVKAARAADLVVYAKRPAHLVEQMQRDRIRRGLRPSQFADRPWQMRGDTSNELEIRCGNR